MRSWDVGHISENLEIIEEVVRIMREYPSLILHVKATTVTKMTKEQREKDPVLLVAFRKDFSQDFPWEPMDPEMPYAQARVLSLKRILGQNGVSHKRIRSTLELSKERKVTLEVEIPATE